MSAIETRRGRLKPSGRVETKSERNERMSKALVATLEAAEAYDQDPEGFESALDRLVVVLGSVGAAMGSPDPSETLEAEPPARDSLIRASLGRSLLWGRKDGLPEALRGPLYPVTLTESRWRRLPRELRKLVTCYGFKRKFVGRPAQFAYEQLAESGLPSESLAEFEQAMLAYA